VITQCCIHELYLQGKTEQPAVDLAKTFERRKCNHREPIPGDECLTGVVGDTNKHRYVIASQSQPLRVKLRTIPAVPIVHVNRSVMVLEPPSDATLKTKEMKEEEALHPSAPDMALAGASTVAEPVRKRKKGPKGPNPLSVKKKIQAPAIENKGKIKMKSVADGKEISVAEKRKRGAADESDDGEEQFSPEEGVPRQGSKSRKRKRKRKGVEASGVEQDT